MTPSRDSDGTLPFLKMHGLGNDFVVIDGRDNGFVPTPSFLRAVANRKRGVGCDQFVILRQPKSPQAGIFLEMYNADASPLGACGNATRCIARLMFKESGRKNGVIETISGLLTVWEDASGLIAVDFGVPGLGWKDIPLAREADTLHAPVASGGLFAPCCVSMGNPHAVYFVPDVDAVALAEVGPHLETDTMFPDRCNIEIAQIIAPDRIRMRVWERGTGITEACGSGACATLVAAVRRGLSSRRATIVLDGGELIIEWRDDDHVLMIGPIAHSFSGILTENLAMTNASPEIVTFGCRLNSAESETMLRHAKILGLSDIVIVNTCAVTGEAERQAGQAIRRLKRQNPAKKIIVTGCASHIDPQKYKNMPEVDHIISNDMKLEVESFRNLFQLPSPRGRGSLSLALASDRRVRGYGAEGLEQKKYAAPTMQRAFIQIQNGCDHRCTFCIIPYGRGASRSKTSDEIAVQLNEHVAQGFNEIVLTGVDIASYGRDLPGTPTLGMMIGEVLQKVPQLQRLRLSSLDPAAIDEPLWDLIAHEPRLMPHLHLSLQAGDNMVLKRMKRRHSRDDVLRLCERARQLRPDIVFGADIIAGFPTETDAMFMNTYNLVEQCGLTWLHVFPYSPRTGTPAAKMPQVRAPVRKERADRLRALGEQAMRQYHQSLIGTQTKVLVENNNIGCTPHFAKIKMATPAPVGQIVDARCVRMENDAVVAELL